MPCVFDRIGKEVLQHAAQELAVAVNGCTAGHDDEPEALVARSGPEFLCQGMKDFINPEGRNIWFVRTGIEFRNIKKRRDDLLNCFQRCIHIAHEFCIVAAPVALDKTGGEQARGIERLQDIVACRRNKTGLADIGRFCLSLRHGKGGIETGEFHRALLHPAFQRLVHFLQDIRGADAFRLIRHRCHHAAIRHGA